MDQRAIIQGFHLIDLLYWYFGEVNKVNVDNLSVYSKGIEDFSYVMLEFKSGIQGWIDASWSVRFKRKMESRIEIVGDNGRLVNGDDTVDLFLDKSVENYKECKTYLTPNDLFTGIYYSVRGAKFAYRDQEFLHAILEKRETSPSVKDGYHVQKIVDASYQSSSQNGAPVYIQ